MIAEIFLGLQFVGCILLWLIISHTMRAQQIKKTPTLLLSSVFATFFLILVIRLSVFNLVYYLVCAGLFSIFSVIFCIVKDVKIRAFDTFMNFILWPQAICLTLFYYSIADEDTSIEP